MRTTRAPIRTLFMQSQSFFGSDSGIHALLMRHFDRDEVEVHVARTVEDNDNPAVSTIRRIAEIPDIHIRPTNFGPSIHATRGLERVRRMLTVPAVPPSLASLAMYIRRNGINVIHSTEKPRDAFYGVLLGKLTGARSVVHLHVKYADWLSPQVVWALHHSDAVIGVSRFVADTVIEAGIPAERVFSVVNALDLRGWDPSIDGRRTLRALGIPDSSPVIGIASRLYYWKGHSYLLDALAIVREAVPHVKLVIVGEDDPRAHPSGGSFRLELEEQTRRLGLEENVVFTGFRTDVREIVAGFDVYAMPTWEEPCAVAFLEAMAMEKPVVAWRSGGTAEMVVHHETGLLTEPRSTPALADALLTLLRDPGLARQFGLAGRRRLEQVLNPARMAAEVADVYRATLRPARVARLTRSGPISSPT